MVESSRTQFVKEDSDDLITIPLLILGSHSFPGFSANVHLNASQQRGSGSDSIARLWVLRRQAVL